MMNSSLANNRTDMEMPAQPQADGGAEVLLKPNLAESMACITAYVDAINGANLSGTAELDNDARNQLVLDATNDGVYDWDIPSNTVFWSDRYYEMLGLVDSKPEPTFEMFISLIHPEDREKVASDISESLASPCLHTMEYRIRHASGEYLYFLCRGRTFFDDNQVPMRLSGLVRDVTPQKRAELALRESEERYRLMADASPNFSWILDALGGLKYFNQTALSYFGIPLDAILDTGWECYTHPEDRETAVQVVSDAISKRSAFKTELRFRRSDGQYLWFIAQGEPSFYPNGELYGFVGSAIDIHDRKLTERALQEQEERLRLVYEASNDAIWDTDYVNGTAYYNSRFYECFGFDKETPLSREFLWSTIHPADLPRVKASFDAHIKDPRVKYEVECRIRHSSGEYRHFYCRGKAIHNDQGQLIRMVGSMMDITERKLAEEAIQSKLKHERMVHRIVEIVSHSLNTEAIWAEITRELGLFFNADRCTLSLLAREGENLHPVMAGQYCASPDILPLDPKDRPIQGIRALNRNTPGAGATQIINVPNVYLSVEEAKAIMAHHNIHPVGEKGTTVDLDAIIEASTAYHQKYGNKSILSLEIFYRGVSYGGINLYQCQNFRTWTPEEVAILEDIAPHVGAALYQTELYQKEQQARQEAQEANLRKSSFLANMSHELRTPLNAIIGYAEMLAGGMGGDLTGKQEKYVTRVVSSGRHLLDMVNEILDLSKIEAGKVTLNREEIDIERFLETELRLFDQMAHKQRVSLSYALNEGVSVLYADRLRLKQIFLNLISNAIKFNHPGGTVHIQVSNQDNQVVFDVQDTGIGIPSDKMTHLFSEFYQVDTSYSRQFEGTGLGLAVTKVLIELHGGDIQVISKMNAGSTFTVRLPQMEN